MTDKITKIWQCFKCWHQWERKGHAPRHCPKCGAMGWVKYEIRQK